MCKLGNTLLVSIWVTDVIVWQIVVAALAFFLGKDEESKDKEDSDSDQEV